MTDTEIIQKVLGGEKDCFAYLIDRYKNYVFTLMVNIVGNREDAEEAAQDSFIKAYRCLADFRGESKFSTWLYTIVRTTGITYLRKRKQSYIPIDREIASGKMDNQESEFRADLIERKSRYEQVNRAICMLGTEDAQVINLFYKGEQSLVEIGQIMGLEPNTVKVKLFRARQKLKEKLEKYLSEKINLKTGL